MKKLLLLVPFILISLNALSQTTDEITLFQMNKVQLAQIYLTEVNRVVKKMPTIAFDSSMADIPKSKYVNAKFEKMAKKIASYNETLLEQYAEIIPYADKKDLVQKIIYLRTL